MSDEEDTTILLSNGKVRNTYKEITIVLPVHNSPKKRYQPPHGTVQITSIVTFLAGFIYGYDMPNVLCYLGEYAKTFELSCIYQTLLLVTWGIGGIVALILVQLTKSWWHDRRLVMIYSMFIILVGTVFLMLSPFTITLYTSRALIGFGCVLSMTAHCVFIAELSDDAWRGYRISLHQFGIAVGIFVCLVTTFFLKSSEYGWRFAITLNIIPITLHLIFTVALVPKISVENKLTEENWNKLLENENNTIVGTTFVLLLITLGEHVSGRQSVLSYAPTAFIKLGIDPSDVLQSVSITISIVRLICTGISLNIVDKLGRKPTLLMSNLIMLLSGLMLAILLPRNSFTDIKNNLVKYGDYCPYFRIVDSTGVFAFGAREQQMQLITNDMMQIANDAPPPFPMLPTPLSLVSGDIQNDQVYDKNLTPDVLSVIAILVFEAAHALGPATVMCIIIIEMLPFEKRFYILTYIISLYWIIDLGLTVHFSIFTSRFSDEIFNKDLLYIGLVFCLANIIIIYFNLPETKGKSFEEISFDLENNLYMQITSKYLSKIPGLRDTKTIHNSRSSLRQPVQETVI